MDCLWIKETFVDESQHARYGDSDWYETFTDNIGKLFKSFQKEYGKASKMFKDTTDGKAYQIGWVFTGKAKYEDTGGSCIRSVWVEVSKTAPIHKCQWVNITNPF